MENRDRALGKLSSLRDAVFRVLIRSTHHGTGRFSQPVDASKTSHAIAKQAGAIDDESGLELSMGCFDDLIPVRLAQAVNARADLHGSPCD